MEFLWICLIVMTLANACISEEIIQTQRNDFSADFGVDHAIIEQFHKDNARRGKIRTLLATPQKLVGQLEGLQQLAKEIPSNPPQVLATLIKLGGNLAGLPPNDPYIANAMTVTKSMETNWKGLTSRDPRSIGKAVCNIVATASAFVPPPYGSIVSSVVGVINNMLAGSSGQPQALTSGAVIPRPPSMSEIVGEVMQKELQQHYSSTLMGKIQGALDALDANQMFLNGYQEVNTTLTDRDYQFMISQFDFLTKLELRGEVMALIGKMATSKKKEDATGALKLIDRYLVLTSMVEVLMHTMKSILERDPQTQLSAFNLGRAIEASRLQSKRYLEFLRNPKQENGVILSTYIPSQNPNLETYLDSVKITPAPLTLASCYNLADKTAKQVKQKKKSFIGKANAQSFQFINKGKFWTVKTAEGLVCSSLSSQFLEISNTGCSMENERAQFRIYQFTDGGYLMLNNQWPTSPLRLNKKGKPDDAKAISISAGDTTWDETEPEYVWQLKETKCQEGK